MYQLPVSKIKLTNVAVVKLNKDGKHFEIACYRNKVLNYRQGIETDLSEVLQTERVFVNAQKGEFANQKVLQQVFGTTDELAICQIILTTGHVQVSDLERSQQSQAMHRMIATFISEHCISPQDGRSYTVTQISHAMKEAEYAVHPTRSLKKQSMDCLKRLQTVLPIVRAKMELLLTFDEGAEVTEQLEEWHILPTVTTPTSVTVLVDPSQYRPLEELMKKINGRLEILRQVVKEAPVAGSLIDQQAPEKEEMTVLSVKQITETVQDITLRNSERNDDGEVEEDDDEHLPSTRRAEQKKQQKQSKKAKRRDKEEAMERQERIQAETKRREDREGVAVTTSTTELTMKDTNNKACNTCGGSFTAKEYRAHFKSDWHRYNQKLLLKGMAAVSENEFLLCDADFLAM